MDFALPPVGEGLFEVELVRWLVRPGDAVHRGQGLMEVMSDKATMEVPAPFAGTVASLSATPGAKIKVGQVVLAYNSVGEAAASSRAPVEATSSHPAAARRESTNGHSPPAATATPAATTEKLPPASPSVRLVARKLGVDLGTIAGTGPHGRILLDDLTPFFSPATPAKTAPAPQSDAVKLDYGKAGTRVKLVGLRRKIAEHMVAAKRQIPHYSYVDECDLSDLVRLRGQLREPFARQGVKLTYLAFFVKAVARALKEIPIVNSTYNEESGEIVLHDHYHVGVAVAAPAGLLVPVVKDADSRDLASVATEIERLSTDARAGRSRLEDVRGSTFTVTSVGNIGGLISTPIINHPEVGILGIGKVVKRPVYDSHGKIRPADMVYLSFSFDHRIVDGAVGAAFGNAVMKHLLNPATILLPEKFGG